MLNSQPNFKTIRHKSITEISKEAWNQLNSNSFPFQTYEFLSSLELSQSIHPNRGQVPYYICLYQEMDNSSSLVAALPCYIKNHSYGEYIFDWQWANFFESHNVAYYPKLMAYTPFTPVTGPKFLIHNDFQNKESAISILTADFANFSRELNCKSYHFLYLTKEEVDILNKVSKIPVQTRQGFQFNWRNQDYEDFQSFESSLKKNRRKNLRKERNEVRSSELIIKLNSFEKEASKIAHTFYQTYLSTIDKKHSNAYLNQSFFELIFKEMQGQILLFEAYEKNHDQPQPIAQSLSFYNSNEVYGRYWGCQSSVPFLHFELCYYRQIEFAIKNQIPKIQAGAQGIHKMARGFLPDEIYSQHFFHEESHHLMIQNYIKEENVQNKEQVIELLKNTPFSSTSKEN